MLRQGAKGAVVSPPAEIVGDRASELAKGFEETDLPEGPSSLCTRRGSANAAVVRPHRGT